MITEENIAAATIAQIFGSELFKAQQNAQTESGSSPQFVKVHPKDILLQGQNSSNQQQYKTNRDRRMLEMLQREAEAACPLPQQPISPPIQQPPPIASVSTPLQQTFTGQNPINTSSLPQNQTDVWTNIACSLQRIADRLDAVEITLKKKRIRRK